MSKERARGVGDGQWPGLLLFSFSLLFIHNSSSGNIVLLHDFPSIQDQIKKTGRNQRSHY